MVEVRSVALSAAIVAAACSPTSRFEGCRRDPEGAAGVAPAPVELVPDAGLRPDSAVANGAGWQAALTDPGDAIELARLAEVEGATGLLAGLEEGGAVGLVALAALPLAEDAEIATTRLAEIAAQLDDAGLGPLLDCLEGIVQRPRAQVEPLNPLGLHAAFDAMVEVANRKGLAPSTRARAVSVGRLIAQRGPYDTKLLPTEFDR